MDCVGPVMKHFILLVGIQGSGKTTLAHRLESEFGYLRISQDVDGKVGHWNKFEQAIAKGVPHVLVDRINHTRAQRARYLREAKAAGYTTVIHTMHVPYATAMERLLGRTDHETLYDENYFHSALIMFSSQYEYVQDDEADIVERGNGGYDPFLLDLTSVCKNRRTILIGDVHGCYDELQLLLKQVKWDREKDVLLFAGDLIDRGPKIAEVLDFVGNEPNTYTIMSNHENKFLRHLRGNKVSTWGLRHTLEQCDVSWNNNLRMWMESLPYAIKFANNSYLVHGGIVPTRTVEQQGREALIYARTFNPATGSFTDVAAKPWYSFPHTQRIYFGHAVHDKAFVSLTDTALDGGCVHGGVLRAVIVEEGKEDVVEEVKSLKQYHIDLGKLDVHSSLEHFEQKVLEGYVSRTDKDNLVLYNYADKCTYDRMWDQITTQCRGIIFDKNTGACVARPFSKFFNIGEHETTFLKHLPDEPFEVFDKCDGSLGIIWNYDGKWNVSTRGSFTSEQAKQAAEMLSQYDLSEIDNDLTLLTEIIYPENRLNAGARLVVDYGGVRQLVLLAALNRTTGEEMSRKQVELLSEAIGMPLVKSYSHSIEEMIELQKTLPAQREGFVVRFSNGLRVKIKGDEYMKMHKILNSISPLSTWEVMKDGIVPEEYLITLPEEVWDEIKAIQTKLEASYSKVKHELWNTVESIPLLQEKPWKLSHEFRKQLGLFLMASTLKHKAAVFNVVLGKGEAVDSYLMDQIRPRANVLT